MKIQVSQGGEDDEVLACDAVWVDTTYESTRHYSPEHQCYFK